MTISMKNGVVAVETIKFDTLKDGIIIPDGYGDKAYGLVRVIEAGGSDRFTVGSLYIVRSHMIEEVNISFNNRTIQFKMIGPAGFICEVLNEDNQSEQRQLEIGFQ